MGNKNNNRYKESNNGIKTGKQEIRITGKQDE